MLQNRLEIVEPALGAIVSLKRHAEHVGVIDVQAAVAHTDKIRRAGLQLQDKKPFDDSFYYLNIL